MNLIVLSLENLSVKSIFNWNLKSLLLFAWIKEL